MPLARALNCKADRVGNADDGPVLRVDGPAPAPLALLTSPPSSTDSFTGETFGAADLLARVALSAAAFINSLRATFCLKESNIDESAPVVCKTPAPMDDVAARARGLGPPPARAASTAIRVALEVWMLLVMLFDALGFFKLGKRVIVKHKDRLPL